MNLHPENEVTVIEVKPSKKNKRFGTLVKLMAVNFLILSILLIVLGLIPQQKPGGVDEYPLQPVEVGTSHAVDIEKGEILIIDYSVEGKDASFYLTYGNSWSSGNHDYIVKKDHATIDHFEVDIDKTGFYYLNFEGNPSSPQGTFQVTLSYKILTRFTPFYIISGITSLLVGLGLTIFYLWWKKKPHMMEDEYIRL
jgi:hypothetical protein